MANHTLDTLTLPPGLIWKDEFSWRPVISSSEYAVTGALVVDVAERTVGRPITLESSSDKMGWVLRATLETLYGFTESPDSVMTLTLADSRTYSVIFRPGEEPITAKQISDAEIPPVDWPYNVTLRLIEVST